MTAIHEKLISYTSMLIFIMFMAGSLCLLSAAFTEIGRRYIYHLLLMNLILKVVTKTLILWRRRTQRKRKIFGTLRQSICFN